ncbi:osteoclast stimulatory transmembrane protein [Anomaloglossus baeobatrachus]|uniref:osteoclast stimulatory transmembrane protein n=1 Tax=Anomaloglossus baeobatrachus TaxID=238106 RepID=UPI003F4FA177
MLQGCKRIVLQKKPPLQLLRELFPHTRCVSVSLLRKRFRQKGYPSKLLEDAFSKTKQLTQDLCIRKIQEKQHSITKSEDKLNPRKWSLVTTFCKSRIQIHKLLEKYWFILQGDPLLRDQIPPKPSIIYRRNINLKNLVAPSNPNLKDSPKTTIVSSNNGNYRCNTSRCKCCEVIGDKITCFTSRTTNALFPIQFHLNCQSTYVIYLLECTCGLQSSCWQNFKKIYLKIHGWYWELSSAYSDPIPKNWQQILILFILCFVLTSLAGTFLYIWLSHSLQYESVLASILALTTTFLLCIILVLIHPIRCILTIIIPTLGTKQGRRLLLSTCFMFMAINILPNIFRNLKNIFQIISCISQHSSEKVINSTKTFQDLIFELRNIVKKTADVMAGLQLRFGPQVNLLANINSSLVSNQISAVANNMKKDFETVELAFKDLHLVTNRVIAGFFILYVLYNSTWYLRNYLTNIKFDNKYITRQLIEMAQKNNITDLNNCSSLRLIKSTGFKMSRKELGSILFRLLNILVFALLSVLIIAMDHIVFQLALEVGNWVEKLPAMQVTFYMNYNYQVSLRPFIQFSNAASLHVEHQLNFTFLPEHCKLPESPPDPSVTASIVFIYCILIVVICLETYAQRLCRKISAMFYRSREEERISFLLHQIVKNR